MRGHWCPGDCHTLIGPKQYACASCLVALEKYLDENAALLSRLAAPAIADLERSLARHAEFDRLYPS